MRVAVVNQKGGVGKTTVALQLAASLLEHGRSVLVVDLDPQANATSGLGVWDPPLTVDRALAEEADGSLSELVVESSWPLVAGRLPDVAPSSPALAAREPQLVTDPIGAQDRLDVALKGDQHEVVIIDCPPSLGLLTVNGLFAADRALVVTEPAAWSSDGVEQVLRTIRRVGERSTRGLDVAGLVVNRLARTRDARYWFEHLVEAYPALSLPPIRHRAAVAEAAAQSLPLQALGSRAGAAEARSEFAELARSLGLASASPDERAAPSPLEQSPGAVESPGSLTSTDDG